MFAANVTALLIIRRKHVHIAARYWAGTVSNFRNEIRYSEANIRNRRNEPGEGKKATG